MAKPRRTPEQDKALQEAIKQISVLLEEVVSNPLSGVTLPLRRKKLAARPQKSAERAPRKPKA